ncbi:MAG: hypothetical protein QMD01_00660 [Thermodesulfovibrionales bacterium]|nr:hypothetical protein [Thermodesulfovibrionales bacterium]
MSRKGAAEYINEFLYFVIRTDKSREGAFIYCSGVNLSLFLPITKGRHGLGSNPAMRGLQQVNHAVMALALSNGAVPKAVKENECAGISPTNDSWYTERLLIENASGSFSEEVINYAVINLLKKIAKACMLQDIVLPDKLLEPEKLEVFIKDMCDKYGRQS